MKSREKCVIIGASPDTDIGTIKDNVDSGDFIVCADGGYVYAQRAGFVPDLIIGDFDSSEFPENTDCEKIRLPSMKDDTDINYCVKECVSRGFKYFKILGASGGREDHSYANYCTLKYLSDREKEAEIISRNTSVCIMKRGKKNIVGKKDRIFSVFPFGCDKCNISLKGFLYELDGYSLSSDFPIGTSNEVISDNALITVHEGSAIIMLSKDC